MDGVDAPSTKAGSNPALRHTHKEERVAIEETTETEAPEEATPVEAAQETAQADLSELIDEVRSLAQQALDECRELRAIVTEEALDEAPDVAVLDDDIDPEDLQIEDLLA